MRTPSGFLFKISAALTLAGYFLTTGCVSVDLGNGRAQKSADVAFIAPTGHFKKISNNTVDEAWLDSTNGNTLAFLSECHAKSDLSLQAMEAENLAALENVKIRESKEVPYNEREALHTLADGEVDGVAVRMESMIFKKNDCHYTLSFVGRQKYFDADESVFQAFIKDFKAP